MILFCWYNFGTHDKWNNHSRHFFKFQIFLNNFFLNLKKFVGTNETNSKNNKILQKLHLFDWLKTHWMFPFINPSQIVSTIKRIIFLSLNKLTSHRWQHRMPIFYWACSHYLLSLTLPIQITFSIPQWRERTLWQGSWAYWLYFLSIPLHLQFRMYINFSRCAFMIHKPL